MMQTFWIATNLLPDEKFIKTHLCAVVHLQFGLFYCWQITLEIGQSALTHVMEAEISPFTLSRYVDTR